MSSDLVLLTDMFVVVFFLVSFEDLSFSLLQHQFPWLKVPNKKKE